MKVVCLEKFRNKNKPLEFAWSFKPTHFHAITYDDLSRIYYLLSIDDEETTANIRYRSMGKL